MQWNDGNFISAQLVYFINVIMTGVNTVTSLAFLWNLGSIFFSWGSWYANRPSYLMKWLVSVLSSRWKSDSESWIESNVYFLFLLPADFIQCGINHPSFSTWGIEISLIISWKQPIRRFVLCPIFTENDWYTEWKYFPFVFAFYNF